MGARQIYESVRDQILDGVFGRNGLLPSSRALAAELSVARTTVTAAYEQLYAEGFIEVRQGARPRALLPKSVERNVRAVSTRRSAPARLAPFAERIRTAPPWPYYSASKSIVDFRYGDLAPADFPLTTWKRAMNAAIAQRPERLSYDDPRGSRRLRVALQGYLWRARTIKCSVDQIIVVNGSQQGLDLCARLLLDVDDRCIVESPCYPMARRIFSCAGATLVSIPVDEDGLQTGALARIDARLAYVTPSHQFPLGSVMSISRRQELIAWAQRHHTFLIEDDYDSEYRYDIRPVPPLHGLTDSDNIIYVGTISKTLSPMLRIGYLVVPPPVQDLFASAKQLCDRHSPVAEQHALASLIESGSYEKHVRRARRLNGERRKALLAALRRRFSDRITIEGADAGLHIVVWFDELPQRMEGVLIDGARAAGIGVHSISPHYGPADPRRDRVGIVMGYAALDTRQIERGIRVLADVVNKLTSSHPQANV